MWRIIGDELQNSHWHVQAVRVYQTLLKRPKYIQIASRPLSNYKAFSSSPWHEVMTVYVKLITTWVDFLKYLLYNSAAVSLTST